MKKSYYVLAVVLVSLLSLPVVIAAQDYADFGSIAYVFGGIEKFLQNKTAVFGLMFFLLFFLLYGVFYTALKKSPLFGGKDAPLDRPGKVAVLSLSGIVLLSLFLVRNNALQFATNLATAMNGFFALMISALVYLGVKFSFKEADMGEVSGTKWSDVIAFVAFVLSLRMFASLMDEGLIKDIAVVAVYIALLGVPIFVLTKKKVKTSGTPRADARQESEERDDLDNLSRDTQAAGTQLQQTAQTQRQEQQVVPQAVQQAAEQIETQTRPGGALTPAANLESQAKVLDKIEASLGEMQDVVAGHERNLELLSGKIRRLEQGIKSEIDELKISIKSKERKLKSPRFKDQVTAIKASIRFMNDELLKQHQLCLETSASIIKQLDQYKGVIKDLKKSPKAFRKLRKKIKPGKQVPAQELKELYKHILELNKKGHEYFNALGPRIENLITRLKNLIQRRDQSLTKEQQQTQKEQKAEKVEVKKVESAEEVADAVLRNARKGHGAEAGKELFKLCALDYEVFKKTVNELAKLKATIRYKRAGGNEKFATISGIASDVKEKDVMQVTIGNNTYAIYLRNPEKYEVFKIRVP
ncbi:hypothetical protein KY311_02355 [Candidatus Woesearchaeota archaeon]|nr:hypothetical protein [Candidatus Woesearchaeota archaeon]